MTTAEVMVSGVRSPVKQVGPLSSGEAVVFVHGNPGPSDDWDDLLQRVASFTRAIAPDMPGYGAADKPRNFTYTIDGYADHLAGVIDQLGISRVHLVLHDFGGPWGLTWAARHPSAFASATLINSGILSGYRWHRFARIWRTPVLGELFLATGTRGAFHVLAGRENARLSREQLDRIYDAFRPWATKRAILKLYRATPEKLLGAHVDDMRTLDRPALVVWGTQDPYLPVILATRQREAFPSARVELIEGGGHWVIREDPEAVASLVVPFLRNQVRAS